MKYLISSLIILFMGFIPAEARDVEIKLLQTSDVHGNFFPYNFITQRPTRGSVARVATAVKKYREKSVSYTHLTLPTILLV